MLATWEGIGLRSACLSMGAALWALRCGLRITTCLSVGMFGWLNWRGRRMEDGGWRMEDGKGGEWMDG